MNDDQQQSLSEQYFKGFVHFIKEYLEKQLSITYSTGGRNLNKLRSLANMPPLVSSIMKKEVCIVVPPCLAEYKTSIFDNILREEFGTLCSKVRFTSHEQASFLSIQPAPPEQTQLGDYLVICNMEEEITVGTQLSN
jgi:hypothetical protein